MEYLRLTIFPSLTKLESFHFKYNPALANEIISEELEKAGAEKN